MFGCLEEAAWLYIEQGQRSHHQNSLQSWQEARLRRSNLQFLPIFTKDYLGVY